MSGLSSRTVRTVSLAWLVTLLLVPSAQTLAGEATTKPLLLAHYMPWYMGKPTSSIWGWHWTMNHFDPEKKIDGRREVASHFHPSIGPYDSGDPHVIEYQLLTMKLAGIDGVIVDWYGLTDLYDYAFLHKNTQQLVEHVERFGMKFLVCYEDQTIPKLVEAKRLDAANRVQHAASEINWLGQNWFQRPSYVTLDDRPVLLSFGQSGLSSDEWSQCLKSARKPVCYFSEHTRRPSAVGAFDWPIPKQGLAAADRFRKQSATWNHAIPVAYPRFVDVYKKAGVHDGYGLVEDKAGATFKESLSAAMKMNAPIVQIATWNDWGEGTQIEPSIEYGYRDLEVVLQTTRESRKDIRTTAADLRLPEQLLQLRRKPNAPTSELNKIAMLLSRGSTAEARTAIHRLLQKPKP